MFKSVKFTCFFILFKMNVLAQNEIILIESYTEESSINYLNKVISDTNNLLISLDVPFGFFNGIENGLNEISGWEESECAPTNQLIQKMVRTNRFYSFPKNNEHSYFNDLWFSNKNSNGLSFLKEKYDCDLKPKDIKTFDESTQIEFASDFDSLFKLNIIDSYLLYNLVSNNELNPSDSVFKSKKVIYVLQMNGCKNINYFINEYKENCSLLVTFKGIDNKRRKYTEYQQLNYNQLIRKCWINDDEFLLKKELLQAKIVYVKKFVDCFNG